MAWVVRLLAETTADKQLFVFLHLLVPVIIPWLSQRRPRAWSPWFPPRPSLLCPSTEFQCLKFYQYM